MDGGSDFDGVQDVLVLLRSIAACQVPEDDVPNAAIGADMHAGVLACAVQVQG
jgi:hypothetical protein